MPPLRRDPPADPLAAARLAALSPRRAGWVPPRGRSADGAVPVSPSGADVEWSGEEGLDDAEDGAGGRGVASPTGAGDGDGPGRTPSRAAGSSPLDRWRGARADPGRRGVAVLGVLALLAGLLAGAVALRSRPQAVTPPSVQAAGTPVPGGLQQGAAGSSTATPSAGAGAARTAEPAELVVAVAGKVRTPGLVRLPAGSRVADAVTAAGGAAPDADLTLLNLARRLVDGEQVLVGLPQPAGVPRAPPAGSAGAAAPGAAAGPLDLNAATLEQLDGLPGIGPVLAQKILDWRTEHGRFDSIDQLREVSGIGEAKYAELESEVRV